MTFNKIKFSLVGLIIAFTFTILLESCEGKRTAEVSIDFIDAEFAKGFRWGTVKDVFWLECINPTTSQVLARVVRDSLDFKSLAEFNIIDPELIVLGKGKRVATLSTTHVSLLDKGAGLEHWAGGAFITYLQNARALARIEDGRAVDLGGEPEIDREKCVESNASALLIYPFGDPLQGSGDVLGIPVIPVTEYLEPNPLGRAEWMRALGWLVGESFKADSLFSELAQRYVGLRDGLAGKKLKKPLVFTGSVKEGKWFAPGGGSLVAKFIEDAGGEYMFKDSLGAGGAENISLDIEVMMVSAVKAEFWGLVLYAPGGYSLEKLIEEDARHAYLIPQSGKVFYCNTAESDYFGDMIVEPDVILSDLVALFHPETMGSKDDEIDNSTFKWLPKR